MKKIISMLVIVTILLTSFNINVYANTGSVALGILSSVVNDFVQLATPSEQDTIQLWGHMLQASGLVGNIPQLGIDLSSRVISAWATAIDADQANATTQENIACIKEAVESMVDTSGGNVSISDSFKNAFLVSVDYYTNEQLSYLWSYTADDLAGLFSSVDAYIEAKKLMGSDLLSNNYYFLCSYYGINKLYSVSKTTYPYLFINGTTQTVNETNNYAWGNMINGSNNTSISMDVYNWDGTNKEWVSAGTGVISCYGLIDISKTKNHDTATNQRAFFLSNTSHIQIRYIIGTATVPDIIYQPYYYNNDVWQDFSTSSGDYTFTPSNINTVTYGDVTSYIDDSNTENGYPPSVQDINIHIEEKDEENKDTSGGGGSGSGGDDSGGSGGGIGSVGDIFGWLKQLGSVIASLIKGIGEFLTEVVTGLVSAITDLLSGIGDLIVSITETLPTTFMNWFGTLFEWMPAEWKALLSASLVFMVLWGIIKLIRG